MDNKNCNTERSTVVGVFESQLHAQDAVRELKAMGFTDAQIGVVTRNNDVSAINAADKTESADMASVGAATGAGIGALWALGIAAGALPAIGPLLAGGLLMNVLGSAAAGAAVVGLTGALVGLGVPDDEAEYYEGELKTGRTIVTVKAANRCSEAFSVLQRHGAYDMQTKDSYQSSEAYRTKVAAAPIAAARSASSSMSASMPSSATVNTSDRESVRLHEEKLDVQKSQKEAGEVRVRKEVVTEHKTIDVPVTREEVVIERRPASGVASSHALNPGEEVRIPVKEEQVNVSKKVVAKEDVSIGKRKVTDTERVNADVSHEEIRVEEKGSAKIKRS